MREATDAATAHARRKGSKVPQVAASASGQNTNLPGQPLQLKTRIDAKVSEEVY